MADNETKMATENAPQPQTPIQDKVAESSSVPETNTTTGASAPEATTATAEPVVNAATNPITASTPKASETAPATAEPAPTHEPGNDAAADLASIPNPNPDPLQQLWEVVQAQQHREMWGVDLEDPAAHIPSQVVLQKFLNANDGDLDKSKAQLLAALEWRAQKNPLQLVKKVFSKTKFEGLGFVTTYTAAGNSNADQPEDLEVFTWNIYGGVKNMDETFGDLQEFIDWRVALMEIAIQELHLATANRRITADEDPYKMFQVHDYKSVSFLRQSAQVKSASSETIKVFAQNYPELLKEKFFVNVPVIMGFLYGFMKMFVAPKTIKKFHPMSNGGKLADEFAQSSRIADLGQRLPVEYGGKGEALKAQGKEPLLE